MPYTSAKGYMFSLLNKAGEIGIRFPKEVQKKYLEEFDTTLFKSYVMTLEPKYITAAMQRITMPLYQVRFLCKRLEIHKLR